VLGLVAEPGEGVAQVVELPELLVDIGEACVEEVADVAAGRLAVVADVEDLLDLGGVSPAAWPRWMKSIRAMVSAV
jgi:hypothetical protein